jgi:hypothetical protein
MATASPLDHARNARLDELDWAPLDLEQVPAEARAVIEAAEGRIRDGSAQIVWEEDVPAALAEMRRANAG